MCCWLHPCTPACPVTWLSSRSSKPRAPPSTHPNKDGWQHEWRQIAVVAARAPEEHGQGCWGETVSCLGPSLPTLLEARCVAAAGPLPQGCMLVPLCAPVCLQSLEHLAGWLAHQFGHLRQWTHRAEGARCQLPCPAAPQTARSQGPHQHSHLCYGQHQRQQHHAQPANGSSSSSLRAAPCDGPGGVSGGGDGARLTLSAWSGVCCWQCQPQRPAWVLRFGGGEKEAQWDPPAHPHAHTTDLQVVC